MPKIYTIGFTRKSAEIFFSTLEKNGVKRIIDVRLNNVSQLAGFTKKDDLGYFLKTIAGIGYEHQPLLAPAKDMMDAYKKKRMSWPEFENKFNRLLAERQVENQIKPETLDGACFLCSEAAAEKCHRRLVAEYFEKHADRVVIEHL